MTQRTHSAADAESALRQDLAAAFRLCDRFGWSESVGNHFSAALPGRDGAFLLNPRWRHFAAMRARDLLVLDADDEQVMDRPDAPDPSAWTIHGAIHRQLPQAQVILHCHPPYAVALSCLEDPAVLPIDNNTARFYGRTGYTAEFGGIADAQEEGRRIAAAMEGKSVLVMANHGVTVAGDTVAEAFEDLYFFETAARTLILALSTGRPLSVLSDEVARATADGWAAYRGMAARHFDYLKSRLDAEDASWRD